MSAYEPTWQDDLASPPALPLEAVVLGSVGWGVLIFYMTAPGAAQLHPYRGPLAGAET
jgi:hypothetical protein